MLDAIALLIASGHAVEARTISDVRPAADLRSALFDRQLQVLADLDAGARRIALHPSRRAGKTHVVVVVNLERAMRVPYSIAPYICLTGSSAKLIAWPVIQHYVTRFELGHLSDNTMTAHLHNGAQVYARGTDDIRHVETLRGQKLVALGVDECGAQPDDLLRTLSTTIAGPALGDLRGPQLLAGTPPPTGVGYWDDQINPAKVRTRHPIHHWTVRENPHFHDPDGWLAEERDANGWGHCDAHVAYLEQQQEIADGAAVADAELLPRCDACATHGTCNPTYLREYLGLRVVDQSVLVVPIDGVRNRSRSSLPAVNDVGFALHPKLWSFTLSIDLGARKSRKTGKGTLAIVLVATHPHDKHDYIVSTEQHDRWIVDRLFARVEAIRDCKIRTAGGAVVTPGRAMVTIADLGGLGVSWADEAAGRHGWLLEPADKSDRHGAIRWIHDRVVTGLVQVLNVHATEPFVAEAAAARWDPDHLDVDPRFDDHLIDAAMYGLRRARNWTGDRKPKPDPRTPEGRAAIEAQLEREAEARAARRGPRRGWYR